MNIFYKKIFSLLFISILIFGACKNPFQEIADSKTPLEDIQKSDSTKKDIVNNAIECNLIKYADTLVFLKNEANDYKMEPLVRRDGEYGSIPEGLEINQSNGEINVTKSESGLKYLVYFIPKNTTDTCFTKLAISGVDYLSKIYFLDKGDTLVIPIYNSNLALTVPGGRRNGDGGGGSGSSGSGSGSSSGGSGSGSSGSSGSSGGSGSSGSGSSSGSSGSSSGSSGGSGSSGSSGSSGGSGSSTSGSSDSSSGTSDSGGSSSGTGSSGSSSGSSSGTSGSSGVEDNSGSSSGSSGSSSNSGSGSSSSNSGSSGTSSSSGSSNISSGTSNSSSGSNDNSTGSSSGSSGSNTSTGNATGTSSENTNTSGSTNTGSTNSNKSGGSEFDDDEDDDNGNGTLDEPLPGQSVILQGLAIEKANGRILLKKSIKNGVFGGNPKNGDTKKLKIYYRLDDASGKALNKIEIQLHYFTSPADVPQTLKDEIELKQQISKGGRISGADRLMRPVRKPRPPDIVIVGRYQ